MVDLAEETRSLEEKENIAKEIGMAMMSMTSKADRIEGEEMMRGIPIELELETAGITGRMRRGKELVLKTRASMKDIELVCVSMMMEKKHLYQEQIVPIRSTTFHLVMKKLNLLVLLQR